MAAVRILEKQTKEKGVKIIYATNLHEHPVRHFARTRHPPLVPRELEGAALMNAP